MTTAALLKELAADFFSTFAPSALKQVDSMFEQLKFDEPSKLEVNFGLAMPPEMRRRILVDIGISEAKAPAIPSRFIPHLAILKKIVDQSALQEEPLNQKQIRNLVKQEGSRLKLFDYEIDQLLNIFPQWIANATKKHSVELSPANIAQVNNNKKDSVSPVAFNGIIGKSSKMLSMFDCLTKISGSSLSILIQGESGTGKELVAHAIHNMSDRADNNFIPVNCAALPDSIIESELFGHEKGAFTGAMAQKKGYFEIADRGTIFLDEIGETSLNTQVKLLRVLQEQQFYRVGGTAPVKVNVRVITATNRELVEMVKTTSFRHDLYYRINEMTISLPPLRDRRDDLPLLISHFLVVFAEQNNQKLPAMSDKAMKLLKNYNWPGNIRELENALKRAVVLADDLILPEHLPAAIADNFIFPESEDGKADNESLATLVSRAERKIILNALRHKDFNITKTAEKLRVSRRTLQRKMLQYSISKP